MPSDIRSFFGGKPAGSSQPAPPSKSAGTKTGRGKRKIVDDSDEDDVPSTSQQKPPAKKREPTPEGQATTSSDYFGKGKPKKSSPVKASSKFKKDSVETPKASPAKAKKELPETPKAPSANAKATPRSTRSQASPAVTSNGRTSTRARAKVNYNENAATNGAKVLDDDFEGDDDIFAEDYKRTGRGGDDYVEGDDEASEDEVKPTRRISTGKGTQKKSEGQDDDFEDLDMEDVSSDDFEPPVEEITKAGKTSKAPAKAPAKASKPSSNSTLKRKSAELDDESDAAEKAPTTKKKPASARSTPKKAKKEELEDSAEVKAIFDSIPLVRPPSPPAPSGEKRKFPFGGQHANSSAPPAQGSKDLPVGQENCLAGLTFVFTGLLDTLQRDDGQALVKKYGGKVVGAPSSKTSYVVLGSEAGPKKLETIAKNNLKTINEDGLFELIRRLPANGGDSKAAAANEQKKQDEMEKVRKMALEAEEEEKQKAKAAAAATASKAGAGKDKSVASSSAAAAPDKRLWTVKYAPTQISQICGNKAPVERLQRWLRAFPKNQRTGFKLGGQDGSGVYRAVIISGPPGIGKTTAAHLVAKLEGYDVVESNASDTRSKKLVEAGLKGVLDTTSLLGYFAGDGEKVDKAKKKLVLIMDEVDGMSAGDRGGVGALAAVCKKTTVPMILICNERKLPKMKPFDHCTFGIPFRRPTTEQIRARIMTIGFREDMKIPSNVIDALIEGSGADIRQVVNMVSTAKVDQGVSDKKLDYDGSKQMSKAWEKHVILKPWDIVNKILGGGLFAQSSKATLNDKIELYFNDHEFSSLMLEENYLNTTPSVVANYSGRERTLKNLELAEKAANSISEGDLVDRMIHGSQQHWSLMPTHAVLGFVRPASFVAGSLAGNQTGFTSWLGKNSTQNRLMRVVKEIQGHMRLRASGDVHEIRQQYVPLLWSHLVKRLEVEGRDAVPQIIELMDSYFLTKDDWDAILELGVGDMNQDAVVVATASKAAFTRLYNSKSHPMPFMKASNVVAPKGASKEKPDLEEAIDESDEAEVIDEDAPAEGAEAEEDVDLSKDKYVKQPKKKRASAGGKGKKAAEHDDDDDDESDEGPKQKKGKGKPAKGKGKK